MGPSARRVFACTSSAPAFSYGPYGNALQSTTPLTDFNYAGMFYNADSGLSLTQYRAYDPVAGRWLSRDPAGESSDAVANLYRYVNGNPVSLMDPLGLACGDTLQNLLNALASNPLLLPMIIVTEIAGGGPEDPLADVIVAEEIAAAEGGTGLVEGASSLYDTSITNAGSQYLNVQTDVGAQEFQSNLLSNGYNVVNQTPTATVLSNGTDTYTIYTRTSTGQPGAQFFGGNGSIVKYSLSGP
ncbi:MAG: RHS repeat-associated core domain-containing protein [Methylovirgula sp.]